MPIRKLFLCLLIALSLVACGADKSKHDAKAPAPNSIQLTDNAADVQGRLLMSIDGRIWMLDGGEWTRITSGPNDIQPAWDATGKKVFFVREHDSYSDLYSVVPGKQPVRLMANRGTGAKGTEQFVNNSSWAFTPSPSRNGSLYLLTDLNGYMALARMNTSHPNAVQNLTKRDQNVEDPQVSPNGRQLVYVGHPDGPGQLFIRNLTDSPKERRLTRFKRGVYDPAWTTDGKSVYFVASTNGSSNLYEMQVNGKPHQLSSGEAIRQPTAAGKNGRIVYLKRSGSGWDLWTAVIGKVKGKYVLQKAQQVTKGGKLDARSNLSWMPDPAKKK